MNKQIVVYSDDKRLFNHKKDKQLINASTQVNLKNMLRKRSYKKGIYII